MCLRQDVPVPKGDARIAQVVHDLPVELKRLETKRADGARGGAAGVFLDAGFAGLDGGFVEGRAAPGSEGW